MNKGVRQNHADLNIEVPEAQTRRTVMVGKAGKGTLAIKL